jgi:hypothetical protein
VRLDPSPKHTHLHQHQRVELIIFRCTPADIIAYGLWWAVIISKKKMYMQVAVGTAALYLALNAVSIMSAPKSPRHISWSKVPLCRRTLKLLPRAMPQLLALQTLILIIPAAIYAAKAAMNFFVFVYAAKLFRQEHGGGALPGSSMV